MTVTGGYGVLVGHRLEVLVQVVHKRHARGDVQTRDRVLRDVVQVLHQCTEGVAVSSNDDLLALLNRRDDGLLPVGQDTLAGSGKRLSERQELLRDISVLGVVTRVVLASSLKGGGRRSVTTTPDHNLFNTVLVHRLLLVKTSKGTVVTLVKTPRAGHRDPHQVRLLQDVPQRLNSALEHRRVGQVELETGLLEHLTGVVGLVLALLGQRHVMPARELVVHVPLALAVADEHDLVLGSHF